MKKKKIAVIAGLIILIILNVLIFTHRGVANEPFELTIQLESDIDQNIQVFFAQGNEITEEDSQILLCKENQENELTYNIPAGTTHVRVDFGGQPAHYKMNRCFFSYKNTVVDIELVSGQNLGNTNEIVNIMGTEEGIKLDTEGSDPYMWINTPMETLQPVMEHDVNVKVMIINVIMALLLDGAVLFAFLKRDKILALPIELYHNRSLIWGLSKNDFKTKYAGSYLGIVWAFIQPIVTILVYWFVFSVGFKSGITDDYPFVLYLVTGIIPWLFFQDALNGGTNALIEYNYLVKKVVFKISILPIVKIISAFFVHMFFVLFALILCAAYGYMPSGYTIQILYYTGCTFIFTLALVYGTSAIVVFFRDLSQLINIIMQVGIWMTPIMWDIHMLSNHPFLMKLFKLNPMYYIVTGYRDSMLGQIGFWNHWGWTLYFWAVTAVLFGVGAIIFKRLKPHFADVL